MATAAATSRRRYEFRCWPTHAEQHHTAIERRYRFSLMDVRDDVYFLTHDRGLLPKLNGERRFEMKRLLGRSGVLELWTVALSEDFPLSDRAAQLIEDMFDSSIEGKSFTTPRKLEAALSRVASVRHVRKVRALYKGGNLSCEFTTTFVDPSCLQSVAFESDAQEPILDAISTLGLDACENVHYGAKLRELAGQGARRTFGRVAH